MSLWAVKNDKGEWLSFDASREGVWYTNNPTIFKDRRYAEAQNTHLAGSHVVELVEVPAKIVVSADEAEMLERAKNETFQEAAVIYHYAKNHDGWRLGNDIGDRLMRAYVNGWTVEKPKHYVLPMEGTKLADGTIAYATLDHTGAWKRQAKS